MILIAPKDDWQRPAGTPVATAPFTRAYLRIGRTLLLGALRLPQESTMPSRSISLTQWSGTSVNTRSGDSGCRVQQATWLMAQRNFPPILSPLSMCLQQAAKRGAGEVQCIQVNYSSSGIRSSSIRTALTRYLCCLTILAGQFTIPT